MNKNSFMLIISSYIKNSLYEALYLHYFILMKNNQSNYFVMKLIKLLIKFFFLSFKIVSANSTSSNFVKRCCMKIFDNLGTGFKRFVVKALANSLLAKSKLFSHQPESTNWLVGLTNRILNRHLIDYQSVLNIFSWNEWSTCQVNLSWLMVTQLVWSGITREFCCNMITDCGVFFFFCALWLLIKLKFIVMTFDWSWRNSCFGKWSRTSKLVLFESIIPILYYLNRVLWGKLCFRSLVYLCRTSKPLLSESIIRIIWTYTYLNAWLPHILHVNSSKTCVIRTCWTDQ